MLKTNYWLARYVPLVLKIWFRIFWWYSKKNPNTFLKMSIEQSNLIDRELLLQPEIHLIVKQVWNENLSQDSRGYVRDIEILMKDWGFRFQMLSMKYIYGKGKRIGILRHHG